jgi:hypothetical protein
VDDRFARLGRVVSGRLSGHAGLGLVYAKI